MNITGKNFAINHSEVVGIKLHNCRIWGSNPCYFPDRQPYADLLLRNGGPIHVKRADVIRVIADMIRCGLITSGQYYRLDQDWKAINRHYKKAYQDAIRARINLRGRKK